MIRKLATAAALAVVLPASVALSGGHATPEQAAVDARKAHMGLYNFNLAVLGGMARGNIDYNAEAAQGAADNLVALSQMNQMGYWLPGTDSATIEGSRALAAMWENFPDVMAKATAFNEAVAAMQTAAGTDLESLQGAMGALGAGCNDCHKSYRAPRN